VTRLLLHRLLPLWAALLFCGTAAWAQDYKVSAYIDPNQGITDSQSVRLVIVVEGTKNPQVTPPDLRELTNLTLINGPNTTTNIAWINGQTTSTLELRYTLLPEQAGPAVIPAMAFEIDGKSYRTPPFKFNVAKAAAGRPAPGRTRPGRSPESEESAVFIEAKLGSNEIWVGQPVPLDVTLFTLPRVVGFAWRRTPDFANFWVEKVDFDSDADAYRARVNGRVYTAYPMDRKILIPPSPGTFELDSYVGQLQVRVTRNDQFDWFRFGRAESIVRKTEPLTLTVKQLPVAGRPDGFSGAVGSYELEVTVDRSEPQVDNAVALRATVRGEGALRSVGPPAFKAPANLKVFDPQVKESVVGTQGGRIVSTKTWEWIIVPLSPGEFELPAMRFDYFAPTSGRYEVAEQAGLMLTVLRSDETPDNRITRGDVRLQHRDLAFIKPLHGSLRHEFPRAHARTSFKLLLVLPFVLMPVAIVLGRRHARLRQDHGLVRGRRARSRGKRRLQGVRRKMGQSESAEFHEEIARTLVEYLADRCNRSAAGLTYDAADDLLAAKQIPDELRRRFRSCLETCDFVRFVPEAGKAERRDEILVEAEQIIDLLERAW